MFQLFENDKASTWVFTGGANTQGGYSQTKTARNFVGHFEEFIRWELTDEQNHPKTLERYVINTGKKGQSLKDINIKFYELIGIFQPAAVVLMIEKEDYKKGGEGLQQFEKDLLKFYSNIKQIGAVLFIQTPIPDLNDTINPQKYTETIKEIFQKNEDVKIIDHFTKFNKSFPNGELNQAGHIETAKQLMEEITGKYTTYSFFEKPNKPYTLYSNCILPENIYAEEMKKLINEKKPLTWLFIGDSITHGALHTHGYDSFPQLFEKYIHHEKNRTDDIVINTGVSGATTQDFLDNKKARYEQYKHANIVFIMFGTNDCIKLANLSLFRKNLEKIIQMIQKNNAVPILRTPNPCIEADFERGIKIIEYIEEIRNYAEENHIILIDHYKQWIKAAEQFPDIIKCGNWISSQDTSKTHPGANGQLNMFHATLQTLGLWNPFGTFEQLSYETPILEQKK